MLSELDAGFKAAESGETAAGRLFLDIRTMAFIPQSLFIRQAAESARLFEQFFGRDCEAVGDLGGTVEEFQNVIAERTVKFARGSMPRGQFDPAKASVAFGADDVAFLHTGIMHAAHNRSKTRSGRDRPA
jgi:hypothetical protein